MSNEWHVLWQNCVGGCDLQTAPLCTLCVHCVCVFSAGIQENSLYDKPHQGRWMAVTVAGMVVGWLTVAGWQGQCRGGAKSVCLWVQLVAAGAHVPLSTQLHNYIGLSWCEYCRNFMWGLRNQGYRCRGEQHTHTHTHHVDSTSPHSSLDWGLNVHKQCRAETGMDCQPSRLLVKRVYGVELTTLVKMDGTKVPVVISSCIEEVEKRGRSNSTIPCFNCSTLLPPSLSPGLSMEDCTEYQE